MCYILAEPIFQFDFDGLKKRVEASLQRSRELRNQAERVGGDGIKGLIYHCYSLQIE